MRPRRLRGGSGGSGGPDGPPGDGAYGLPGAGPKAPEGCPPGWCEHEAGPKARSTERRSSCTRRTCASVPSVNSASRIARRTPCRASSHRRRASVSGVPVAVRGFHAPDAASASRSSTASSRCASRPKSRPASASGPAFCGLPASTAVCAKAAAVAVSVGSVTVSSGVPGPARDSIPVCRSTASTRTAVSKPSSAPVRAPALSQPAATRRAAAATGRRPNSPSRSATWSRTLADASTSETAAASLAPSPRATGAVRIDRSGQGPAVRRRTSVRSA